MPSQALPPRHHPFGRQIDRGTIDSLKKRIPLRRKLFQLPEIHDLLNLQPGNTPGGDPGDGEGTGSILVQRSGALILALGNHLFNSLRYGNAYDFVVLDHEGGRDVVHV